MSVQSSTVDDASTLPVQLREISSSHAATDESLPVEEELSLSKDISMGSDVMDIDNEVISAMPIESNIPMNIEVEAKILNTDPQPGSSIECRPKPISITMARVEPSQGECKILDVEKVPKLSKWDTLKSKMYLGSAYGGTRMASVFEAKNVQNNLGEGSSKDADKPKDSNFEELDAEPSFMPGQKPNKGSWAKLKAVFGKRGDKDEKEDEKPGKENKEEDEGDSLEKLPKRFSFAWLQKVFSGKRNSVEKKSDEKEENDEEELAIEC